MRIACAIIILLGTSGQAAAQGVDFTFFVGGKAWMMGIVPITLGMVFVSLRALDGRRG